MTTTIRQLSPSSFPELLKEIPDAPEHLNMKGVLPAKQCFLLCVVGSRKYSTYGKDVCEKLISGLRGYPISIVSGLALGIDGVAHRAALSAGLHTIAVPGSGLGEEVLYPRSHVNLANKIIEAGGALLSEFEENFKATPYSFPQRNRIMAGMSHGTLVIEAEERSGTLITSRLATEYNREVMTVPASIFSRNASGPHMLIRLGATPITKSEDILDVFNIETEKGSDDHTLSLKHLSEKERDVIQSLQQPLPRNEVLKQLNLPIQEANVLLSAMEIKGLIEESMGEMRVR